MVASHADHGCENELHKGGDSDEGGDQQSRGGSDHVDEAWSLLVDRREAARLLGVSPGTIDNLRTRGQLPSVKIGARRLYDVEDLRRFVDARKGVK